MLPTTVLSATGRLFDREKGAPGVPERLFDREKGTPSVPVRLFDRAKGGPGGSLESVGLGGGRFSQREAGGDADELG